MQPYFDPTRKTTSKKMEDDLKKNEKNGRRPYLCFIAMLNFLKCYDLKKQFGIVSK